jgi:fatty acyl-CoA reductase
MFKRIMDEKPEVMRKIKIVNGEILENNLGLSESDLSYVVNNAQIVFHLAASLKLEATLRPNILANLTATKKVIDLSKKMTDLLAFVHVSTAFCNVDRDEIEEKVYTDIPYKPVDLIQAANVLTDKQMEKVQNEYLGKHPNTYTFTKRMAEILVHDEYLNSNLPICIVRPSIVGSTLKEPVEGWVS